MRAGRGLSKKVGQPDFSSLGASCDVEVELEHSLLENDLDGFHERIRKVYIACRQAVNDELARHLEPAQQTKPASSPHTNGNGNGSNFHQASAKQIEFAQQLAKQISGLGVRRLETLVHKMHNKPLAALSSIQASATIDVLKDIKAGKIEVNAVLNGVAA